MRATLAKDLAEKDARARDNKRLFQGTVLAVNTATHTVRVKVMQDGPVQVLEDVTYTAQTPPQIGDVGDLIYASSSNHSVRFANPRLGGGNTSGGATIAASNVVNSIKKTGESSSDKQTGNVELEASSTVFIDRTGKVFKFTAVASSRWEPLALGNPYPYTVPQLVFDENGDVIMIEVPL